MTARPARRGFTLLEVMVALSILATSLLAISDVVGGALRNHVRARNVQLAALLARAKMVEVEDHYEWKGFKRTDESDEGTFEDDGHPEVKWRLEITAPAGSLDADQIVRSMTGSDLKDLLATALGGGHDAAASGGASSGGASGGVGQLLGPAQAALTAALQVQANQLAENVKQGLRQVRLTVSWTENGREESFEVKTHLLVLAPAETVPR